MDVIASDATLGAEVRGVNLRQPVGTAVFEDIQSAWHQHAVLLFRDQHLTRDQQLSFTRLFGRLERGLKKSQTAGIGPLSNVRADGSVAPPSSLQARFLTGNNAWHSDSSYKSVGAKASILSAHVVPETGGETEWADMRAAYDALSLATRERLAGKFAVHHYAFSHASHGGLEIVTADDLKALPPVRHSIVQQHPASGRKSLFVGRHASHIEGEPVQASRQALQQLTDDACQPPRIWRHKWAVGDIVIWDNRCVLHRGRPWPAEQARVMVRSTVAGDTPDNEWAVA